MSDYFIHENAVVDSYIIGKDTRIWGFTHILKEAKIGENCNICEHVFIENDVIIGNNVTIKCGVYIWDGVRLEDNVFIGPCATFTNDIHPRSKVYPSEFKQTIVKYGASIGANATILGGIEIGKYATIGAGAVILKNVKPYEVVVGNPGKVIGYNCKCSEKISFDNNYFKCECGLEYKLDNNKIKCL
ncbi:MAG: acyltransferase [Peptostreptococcaceae bacterium]